MELEKEFEERELELKEKERELREIISKYNSKIQEGPRLFYGLIMDPKITLILMIGPLGAGSLLDQEVAKRVAQNYGVELDEYDFNLRTKRWSEPDFKPVFFIVAPDEKERIENAVKKLCVAQRELYEIFRRFARNVFDLPISTIQ
jgi:hypothetical protein